MSERKKENKHHFQQSRYRKRSSTPSISATVTPRRTERSASVISNNSGNLPVRGQNYSEEFPERKPNTFYNHQQHTSMNNYEIEQHEQDGHEQCIRKESRLRGTTVGNQNHEQMMVVSTPLRLTRISVNADSRTQSPSSHSSPCVSSQRSPCYW